MDSHESRDLDGVIDEVARAMTSRELARDLRPAVASRVSSPAAWTFVGQPWWRPGLAAAVAAMVVVAVVMRPAPEPQRPQTVADAGRAIVTRPADSSGHESAPAAAESQAIRGTARPVARQTIVDTEIAGVVDISPVAIVPLEGDDEEDTMLTSSHVVEIAPIDVEPLSISGLELVE
jgi:hypothetical protein